VKHLVGNEAETERHSMNSVIDERALREVYLRPFELAVKEGGALGVMTSYNRLNGKWNSESSWLLTGVLRGEWGFAGIVMTDWFAVAHTRRSANAGLDLEMPGPGRAFGAALAEAVGAGEVDERTLFAIVERLLTTFDMVGALDPGASILGTRDERPQDRALAHEAAVESMVLLRNDGVLPVDVSTLRRVAVIGPNAAHCRIMGGGSAQVRPHRLISPLDALRDALGESVEVTFEPGCALDGPADALRTLHPIDGLPGLDVELFAGDAPRGEPVVHERSIDARLLFVGAPRDELEDGVWSLRATGRWVPEVTGVHQLTLSQCGAARVLLDGVLVLDGFGDPPPPGGTEFFGFGSQEAVVDVDVVAGSPVEVCVEYSSSGAAGIFGVKVGCRFPQPQDLVERARAVARSADVAIVVVGSTDEIETEGRDRDSMTLPGAQDQLIDAVAEASPRTIVVVNTGSPFTMDWADDVAAILQVWFGGQEMGPALADVLLGRSEPAGRLPVTIPLRLEHNPSFGNFSGENGEVRYGESVFVGYRGYELRAMPVRFPFGHGLGYSTFELGTPVVTEVGEGVVSYVVDVPVTNVGTRRGSEVVQCYVGARSPRLARPRKQLEAFAKVVADPGETVVARLVLDVRSFSYWDPGQADYAAVSSRVRDAAVIGGAPNAERRAPDWYADAGCYDVFIGRSSADIARRLEVVLDG
jgi:beta-glucosidase